MEGALDWCPPHPNSITALPQEFNRTVSGRTRPSDGEVEGPRDDQSVACGLPPGDASARCASAPAAPKPHAHHGPLQRVLGGIEQDVMTPSNTTFARSRVPAAASAHIVTFIIV
jgi:hypothetical protein